MRPLQISLRRSSAAAIAASPFRTVRGGAFEHRLGRRKVFERKADRLEDGNLVVADAPRMRAAREIL
jgi:hypothetical protein